MKNTYPSYYKKFRCIADKCPDTCCAGWAVVVDRESCDKYSRVNGGFGQKLRSVMSVDTDGDTVFTNINGRCPFLLESGLCEMFIELGEGSLCRTCTLFPRHISFFGSRKETGLSLSCPEAIRLIMESPEPIAFEEAEEGGEILPNSIDPTLYFTLLKARKTAINILQNREFSIAERMIAFLRFSQELQCSIRQGLPAPDFDEKLFQTAEFKKSRSAKALQKYFSDLSQLEKLDPEWNKTLSAASEIKDTDFFDFISSAKNFSWEAEHLTVYFVFRYFLTAAYDGDVLTKAKFTAAAVITITRIIAASGNFNSKENRLNAMQKWSKEVEHSAENMKALTTAIKKSKFYSIDNLINIFLEEQL